jgi:hypothetical protein
MSRFTGKKTLDRQAIGRALDRIEKEAQVSGRSLREQLLDSVSESWRRRHSKADDAESLKDLPIEFFRELVHLSAGQSRRTPGQQIQKALRPWASGENPKQIKNWYGQMYGEFASGPLSEIMREVLVYGLKRDEKLMHRVYAAIRQGDVKTIEQIARCVALIHGMRHEGTGQAARVASQNKKKIGFAYLQLFETEQKPPTPAAIRIALAREQCQDNRRGKPVRFSDIWLLLQSGATDDKDEPDRQSRYEVVGTRYIKKVIKALRWPLRSSARGPITIRLVKTILDKMEGPYLDDSPTMR